MDRTIWLIGGDARYGFAADNLMKKGYQVKCFGVSGRASDAPNLAAALEGAESVLLPLQGLTENTLRVGEEELDAALIPYLLHDHGALGAGKIPTSLESWFQQRGIYCVSLLEQEDYLLKNAYVTAECAVSMAMEAMKRTLRGAKVLVIGWGRIGKYLSELLWKLGAAVTVSVRRENQMAALTMEGLRAERTGQYHFGLGEYDLICNTVPQEIMSIRQVKETREDCFFLELASVPGGFPPKTDVYRTLLIGRGLPGRMAPRTAGEQLGEAFEAHVLKERRLLE